MWQNEQIYIYIDTLIHSDVQKCFLVFINEHINTGSTQEVNFHLSFEDNQFN